MKPIFLIGFMGTGKTTLGRALVAMEEVNVTFVDLDEHIESHFGMPVKEIFRRHGEAAFRDYESQALCELGAQSDIIVGCGGGTPCQAGNMEWMNNHGVTVVLRASHEALLRRLLEAQAQRPLLNGMDAEQLSAFIDAKQAEREPFYGKAQMEFDSDLLETPEDVAESCRKFLAMVRSWE